MEPLIGEVLGLTLGQIAKDADQDYNERQSEHEKFRQSWWQRLNAQYGQQLQMQTWEQTNYPAQIEQIKKAGLNPGLIYKGAGEGGTIGAMPSNSVNQTAPIQHTNSMALQLGLQTAMVQAQIKNLEANTNKTNVEADKTAGVDTEQTQTATEKMKTEIGKLIAETKNAQLESARIEAETEVAKVEANIANLTQVDIIKQIAIINDKLYGEAQKALTESNVAKETREAAITLIRQSTIEQQLRITSTKAELKLTAAQIRVLSKQADFMIQQNMRDWDKMSQTDREIAIRNKVSEIMKTQTEFNTSGPAQIRQITSIVTDIIGSMSGQYGGGSSPVGFRY